MNTENPLSNTTLINSEADAEKAAADYAAWRAEVVSRLKDAGRNTEAIDFEDCGKFFGNFQVRVCESNPEHAKAVPFYCRLRYCPDCERRAQGKRVAMYTSKLKELADDAPARWSLKKIELTTPYKLTDEDAPGLFEQAWKFFEDFQQILFQRLFADQLTPAEKRRQRISYKQHGIGSLVSSEFGERGRKLHFHMIAFAPYIPKQMITECWLQASGGECEINWVRRIDYGDVEKQVKEQVKYVTKFNNLPARLVPKLADVLDGSRRFRTYGVVRKDKEDAEVVKEPCKCNICANNTTLIRVREYFEKMLDQNLPIAPEIEALAPRILLDLKHRNKSGEAKPPHVPRTARSDPEDPAKQGSLPGFNAVFASRAW